MKKLIFIFCICATIVSCARWRSVDRTADDVYVPQERFFSKEAIIQANEEPWAMIIDTLSHSEGKINTYAFLKDYCSGFYCPNLFIYQQEPNPDGEWALVFLEDVSWNGDDRRSGPRKIAIRENIIYLKNDAGVEIIRVKLPPILLKAP